VHIQLLITAIRRRSQILLDMLHVLFDPVIRRNLRICLFHNQAISLFENGRMHIACRFLGQRREVAVTITKIEIFLIQQTVRRSDEGRGTVTFISIAEFQT